MNQELKDKFKFELEHHNNNLQLAERLGDTIAKEYISGIIKGIEISLHLIEVSNEKI